MNALVLALFLAAATPHNSLARLLGGIDNLLSPADVRANAADPAAALIAIASDSQQTMYVRGRAATMLGRFPEMRSRDALFALAEHADSRLRVKAMKGLKNLIDYGQGFASDPLVMAALAARLDDQEVSVRLHAVWGLARVPAAKPVLAAHLNVETDARVRDLTAKAIER